MNGLIEECRIIDLKTYPIDTQTYKFNIIFTQKPVVTITIDTSTYNDNSTHFVQVHNVTETGFQIRRPETSGTWLLNYIAIGY